MERRKFYYLGLIIILLIALLLQCYTIMSVTQPQTVEVNTQFKSHLVVRTEDADATAHYQIVAFRIPVGWSVDSVYFAGDEIAPTADTCDFLPPGTPDNDPGGQVDLWTQELENQYPTSADVNWVVYQSRTPILENAANDTTLNNLYCVFTTDDTEGDFNIGYFVTNGALDFTDTTYYSYSSDNPITVTGASALKEEKLKPGTFHLAQNFPNPFNPTTTIQYSLEANDFVTLSVFASSGEAVANLVTQTQSAGTHSVKFDAQNLASGIYLYRLQAGNQTQIRKMIVMK